ncbi:hypothetical protein C0Q70_06594 [Pomacea canaliculata]|uniref:Uncharacterized protein n=1 Tax=Pomacea canaliculata TaxID=400727 RepID=A0A2T7PCN7_POMCA|nr:hypothetical protein C0Q70_06594 [Pomacea canaliculata]
MLGQESSVGSRDRQAVCVTSPVEGSRFLPVPSPPPAQSTESLPSPQAPHPGLGIDPQQIASAFVCPHQVNNKLKLTGSHVCTRGGHKQPQDSDPSDSTSVTGPEATSDSTSVTGPEATSDSTSVTGPEATSDSTSVTGPEATSDSTSVTGPEATSDSTSVTGPEATSDSTSVTGPEATSDGTSVTEPEATSVSTSVTGPEATNFKATNLQVSEWYTVTSYGRHGHTAAHR